MKRLLLLLLLITETSASLGQETKFVSRGAENGGFEEYYVLKESKKVKHGTYVRYFRPWGGGYAIAESGNYLNGEKQGVWEYYYFNGLQKSSWNSLREKGAYVNGKKNGVWSSFYLDTVVNITNAQSYGNKRKPDSVNLSIEQKSIKLKQAGMYLNDKKVGEWVSFDYQNNLAQRYNFKTDKLIFESSIKDSLNYNQSRKPLFIGGLNCLREFLFYNYKSHDVLIDKDSTYVTIEFTINTNGSTQQHKMTRTSHSKPLEKEMIRLISSTDFNWLPGIVNGQKTNYEYKISMDIVRYPDTGQNRRYRSFFKILE